MKNKHVFAAGDRVGLMISEVYDEYCGTTKVIKLRYDEEGPNYGTVTDVLSSGQVLVKWDIEWMNQHNKPVDPKTLSPEADVQKEYSRLEQEFDELEKEIKVKLKEAGQIIREANKLAKKTGRDLAEMYEAVYTLYGAMDDAGWRTSSFGC